MDNQDGSIHTHLTDIGGDNVELVLERSRFIGLLFDGAHDLSLAGQVSDDDAQEPSLASLDLSSGEEDWRWDIVSQSGAFVISLVFSLSLLALVEVLFWEMVGLTSHG